MSWFRVRTPVLHWRWLFLITLLRGAWGLLRWLAAHGLVTVGLAAAGLLVWLISRGAWPWLLLTAGAVLVGLGVLMEARPRWYREAVEQLASWRRRQEYERQWEPAMDGAKLSRPDAVPTLMAHRWGGQPGERDLDVLIVHMLPGQLVSDWRAQQTRLAAAFGLQRMRCHTVPGQPGDVQLFGRRYAQLTPQVTAQRVELHPTVQRTVQPALQLVDEEDEPVDVPRGAFPRRPKGRTQ